MRTDEEVATEDETRLDVADGVPRSGSEAWGSEADAIDKGGSGDVLGCTSEASSKEDVGSAKSSAKGRDDPADTDSKLRLGPERSESEISTQASSEVADATRRTDGTGIGGNERRETSEVGVVVAGAQSSSSSSDVTAEFA